MRRTRARDQKLCIGNEKRRQSKVDKADLILEANEEDLAILLMIGLLQSQSQPLADPAVKGSLRI
jgi:hypothetical protein